MDAKHTVASIWIDLPEMHTVLSQNRDGDREDMTFQDTAIEPPQGVPTNLQITKQKNNKNNRKDLYKAGTKPGSAPEFHKSILSAH